MSTPSMDLPAASTSAHKCPNLQLRPNCFEAVPPKIRYQNSEYTQLLLPSCRSKKFFFAFFIASLSAGALIESCNSRATFTSSREV
jgi:hypothetical protein